MARLEVTVSSGYQVTVPSALRKLLKVKPGDKLVFDTDAERPTVEKALSREEQIKRAFQGLDEWRESLPDEVKENIRKHAGWTVNQYHEYYDNLPETKEYIRKKYGV